MQNLANQKKQYLFHHCIPESKKEKEFHNESPNYQKQSKKGGSKKKLQKDWFHLNVKFIVMISKLIKNSAKIKILKLLR